jgi:predicted ATPase/DNA-binding SARP family transcriptional activator
MMEPMRVRLLGGFDVSVGRRQVPDDAWRLRKAKGLVKLLALAPGHQLHREQICELLWPERGPESARNNFHQALHAARRALATVGVDAGDVLVLRDELVVLDPRASVDADEFTAAAEHARTRGDPQSYLAAVEQYTGQLLPEDRYQDWATEPREALRRQYVALLVDLAGLYSRRGAAGEAIEALRTALAQDGLHEPAHRALMRLLADSGRRHEALAQYESLRDALRQEAEADPDPETRRLYRQLLAGSVETASDDTVPHPPATPAHNLPLAASSFVGRGRELDEVARLLRRTRLLTLTGVGGAGKTRLAIEVARSQLGGFEHGVWLVDLAPLSDPELVPHAVAAALGLELPERSPPVPVLVAQLAARHTLLLLDNCEHLIDVCAELAEALLHACPGLTVLATSREALRVDGELAWRVPSLALPDLEQLPEVAELARQASVRLFCERAVAPDFRLDDSNARAVAELCVRLDGMPLALELAAARIGLLSPRQILDRLGEALNVLGSGNRARLTRQRTLEATLDWSHELLSPAERALFRRLAPFAGSFTLEAVEHIAGTQPLRQRGILELLGRLVDKSLVVVERHGDVARYRLLETVRQYARERLRHAGEEPFVEDRHRDWYAGYAEDHDPERAAAAGEEAMHSFDAEHDNLRAALRLALPREPEAALRLATSLWRFWLARGHLAEGRRWLDAALGANPRPTVLRARGLMAAAVFDMRSGDPSRLQGFAAEIVAIHQDAGDAVALAHARHLASILLWALERWDDVEAGAAGAGALAKGVGAPHIVAAAEHTRGLIALGRGRLADANRHLERSHTLLKEVPASTRGFFPCITSGFTLEWDAPDRPRVVFEETIVLGHRLDVEPAKAYVRFSQAWAARAAGDTERAVALAEESAAGFRRLGWRYGEALVHNHLGCLHRLRGDYGPARDHLERSLHLRESLRDRRATGVTLGALGLLAAAEGDDPEAQQFLRRALELFERIEDRFAAAGTLLNLGVVALRRGDLDSARPLLEQICGLSSAPGLLRPFGWIALMLTEIAEQQGDHEHVPTLLIRARETFERIGDRAGLDHCARVPTRLV